MNTRTEEKTGLTAKQADKLLLEYGENTLDSGKKKKPLLIFMGQFKDLMTIILLIATLLSVFVGEVSEALTIILIVFVNALIGFSQEYRTEKTLEALRQMAAPNARVIRDGVVQSIPASLVVPGDLLSLKSGDKVPADCRIADCFSLNCDESILTGESLPIEKTAGSEDAAGCLFKGTVITRGRATAVVFATGMQTKMGKIAEMLSEVEEEKTPLQVKLDQIGKYIAAGCLIICALVSLTGILRGEPLFNMVLTGISLSVAAIPEGLTAIVTIALALGMRRILRRNALVRKLHAVETLGCANIICSDKTGTLTENKMTVKELFTCDYGLEVTGNGYEKSGKFIMDGHDAKITASKTMGKLLEIAVLCNNGQLLGEKESGRNRMAFTAKGSWQVQGEATETALLVMAAKAGLYKHALSTAVLAELPFDSTRKRMTVITQDASGQKLAMTKGAPDIILERCRYYLSEKGIELMTPRVKERILSANNGMAKRALRVIAFACNSEVSEELCEQNMVFVGLAGMIDPPRKECYKAVRTCRQAGIKTVMITGDHKLTACAIAQELKIYHEGDLVLTGKELDAMSPEEFDAKVGRATVFARVNPEHKLKIVRALKRQGNIVAMTGDGVNDAPAVKEADIGVSMGVGGTDVTKEASDLILLDDNFATLVSSVEEGRIIYSNIRKFLRYMFSSNVGEVVTMFFGMIFGLPVILLPIQILLVNLVTDSFPAIALGLEPAEEGIMKQKPRAENESIFSGGLMGKILFRGFLIGFGTLGAFTTVMGMSGDVAMARTAALMVLISSQLVYVFECKSERLPLFRIPLFNNMKLVLAVLLSLSVMLLVVYLPFLQGVFMTSAMTGGQLVVVLLYTMAVPVLFSLIHLKGKENK